MSRYVLAGIVAAFCMSGAIVFHTGPALAGDPLLEQKSPLLDKAKEAFDKGDTEGAARIIQQALDTGHLKVSDKIVAYKLLGKCLAMLGRQSEAVQAFSRLLVLSPDAQIEEKDEPETVTMAFQRAKAMQDKESAESTAASVEVHHVNPGAVVSGQKAAITADVTGLPEGASVTLYYANSMDAPYTPVLMQQAERGKWTASLETLQFTDPSKEYKIYYYIEVTDENDNVLATVGSEDSPMSFRIVSPKPVEQETPYWKKWWFWTAVGGGAAVSITLGLVLGLTLGGHDTGSANVQINLQP
ncbi:MAG: tetratricopeptide repeat protein [Deltaproteobacteria bacterium]|nr:tetratricopeptide repeat protein [Deltaproteobacteria bacterium]